jgi:ribonuclease-3
MKLSDYIKPGRLFTQALTHRSYCNEHPGYISNERLEFLGDSVLSLIISDRLYRLLPESPEGELTSRRSNLVQTITLAEKAKLLELDKQFLLSHGEEESGGRTNTGLLANTFEAVLGAIFIDSGVDVCYQFLEKVFPDQEILSDKISVKDPKSLLQELSQAKGWGTPLYQILSASGPDHAKQFIISVTINNRIEATGSGLSKQKAETAAAAAALAKLSPSSAS